MSFRFLEHNCFEFKFKDNILAINSISQERCLVIGNEGKVFEINRFCPRHGWKFEPLNKGFYQQSQDSIRRISY